MFDSHNIRMRILSTRTGSELPGLYALYNQSQYWTEDVMTSFQNTRLRNLFVHCQTNSPFYARIIDAAGINAKSATIADLKSLPILAKSDIKNNHKDIVAKNLGELPLVRSGKTGGTTGEPLVFFTDAHRSASVWAAFYRYYDWIGVSLASSKLIIWGQPIVNNSIGKSFKSYIVNHLSNSKYLDAFRISDKHFDEYAAAFKRHKPVLVRGYTQSMYELALIFKKHGFQYPLYGLSCTVEPLFEGYRQVFRDVFLCEAFDQYGCGECNSIAFECEKHQGLHITREHCAVDLTANGEAVITDLTNLAFPIINYKVGDNLIVSNEPCSCGRPGPVIKKIAGRSGDSIVDNHGTKLHPEFFTHLINEAPILGKEYIRKYQVKQSHVGHLVWSIEADSMAEKDIEILKSHLGRYLVDTIVDICITKEIPREKSGKFRYVISNVQK